MYTIINALTLLIVLIIGVTLGYNTYTQESYVTTIIIAVSVFAISVVLLEMIIEGISE